MKLLHYGLQRSGTNYLCTLVRRRFRVRFVNDEKHRNRPAHKHFRLYDEKDIIPEPQYRNDLVVPDLAALEAALPVKVDRYLVLSKDPYSWYASYRRWAEHCRWGKPRHHYAREYTLFYGRWTEFAARSDRVVLLRYIDLLEDAEAVVQRLRTVGLEPRRLPALFSRRIRRVPQSATFTEERRRHYVEREYLRQYTPADLAEINAQLDPEVMARLGYEIESTAPAPTAPA